MSVNSKIDDVVEQLTKLAKLRTDGVLSDEEFQKIKTKLISEKATNVPTAAMKSSLIETIAPLIENSLLYGCALIGVITIVYFSTVMILRVG